MSAEQAPKSSRAEALPILPLRNAVLFPMSVVPINVRRPRAVRLVEELMGQERALVGVVAQRSADTVVPGPADLYEVGTVARVVKVLRLGRSNYSVVLNGLHRMRLGEPAGLEPYLRAQVTRLSESRAHSAEAEALAVTLRERTRRMLTLMPELPKETASILDNVHQPGALADLISSNFPSEHASLAERQAILEALHPKERLEQVLAIVTRQLERYEARDRISAQVLAEMGRSQHDYVLRQQMRTILEELGEAGDEDEIDQLRERIGRADLPEEASRAARKQLSRLRSMQTQSAEYNLTRNYVEWIADLPWSHVSADHIDVHDVQRCLDEDHYGLDQVKRRIVEYSAIRQLRSDKKGPILLFVGPPGVGKTSLGRSIARAMGRRYGRIALGGVRDEAEIRGHRRTYVGALPGRIIQALKKAGTKNPVLVLDELEKMGTDLRGDPAAALLEVLDPGQNDSFVDHYLDLPFDLSQVLFLATANELSKVPGALRDRLEVIEVPGYTRAEKTGIAEQFLVLKQLREHGLTEEQLEFDRESLEVIIDHYTREAGVRGLERAIAAVCRDAVVRLVEGARLDHERVDVPCLERVLGVHRYRAELAEQRMVPGIATGLTVGAGGGDIIFIEATRMPGKGEIQVTGNLHAVMKETAATAVSYVRSRAERLGIDPEWLAKSDLHVHLARGGASRDTVGAGVALAVAVASLLLGRSCRPEVAATGELTLRGSVLPVTGIKDKVLGAHRAGVREVIIPHRNQAELEEVPQQVRDELVVHRVHHVDEVLALMLAPAGALPSTSESLSVPPASGGQAHV